MGGLPDSGDSIVNSRKLNMLSLETDRSVCLTISDTGAGIPEEHLQHIFEPFFTTKKKGTGLGLAAVYSIVKDHGGEIKVSSTVGCGTVFTIYFPVVKLL